MAHVIRFLLCVVGVRAAHGLQQDFGIDSELSNHRTPHHYGYPVGGRFRCPPGWWMVIAQCRDLDECIGHQRPCPGPNTVCRNSVGSFRCECASLHSGDPYSYTGCQPVLCSTTTVPATSTFPSTNGIGTGMGGSGSTVATSIASVGTSSSISSMSMSDSSAPTDVPSTAAIMGANTAAASIASSSAMTDTVSMMNSVAGMGLSTAGTETPTVGMETPTAGTETPTAGTETPAVGTETPTVGTETPTLGTETPTAGTETPTAGTTRAVAGDPASTVPGPTTTDQPIPDAYIACLNPQLANGSRIQFKTDLARTWDQAANDCNSDHTRSRLIKIPNERYNACVRQMMIQSFNQPTWIGLRFLNGAFRWADGSPSEGQFEMWAQGQPSFSNSSACVTMRFRGSVWSVRDCDSTLTNYFCEIPTDGTP